MKYFNSFALLAVVCFLGSCSLLDNDYTCTCTAPGFDDEVYNYEDITGDEVDAAEALCDLTDISFTALGGGCTWE